MTNREAIEYLDRYVGNDYYQERFQDVCELAIFALKKQTPQKYEVFNGRCSCPNCHYFFGNEETLKKLLHWDMQYCKNCGQALDWSRP